MKDLIIVGAGGHAKVIADIAHKNGIKIKGFLDDNVKEVIGYPVLGKWSYIDAFRDNCKFVLGIGDNELRCNIDEAHKLEWATLIHPSAQIGINVIIGCGTVIMANAVINSCARIGRHCIINTAAVVEHDNSIGDYVHISPNATLGGMVNIGRKCHVGIGAVIKNRVTICENSIIGAGGVVINDALKSGVYIGVPAKRREL